MQLSHFHFMAAILVFRNEALVWRDHQGEVQGCFRAFDFQRGFGKRDSQR